ncbi:hypothetical protein E4U59_000254 [Claviceps monticola]|nr:hypothetical protein E4U59_000254 [Claviceps monticola]
MDLTYLFMDHHRKTLADVCLPHRSRRGQYRDAIEGYGHTLLFVALRYTTLASEATIIGLKVCKQARNDQVSGDDGTTL